MMPDDAKAVLLSAVQRATDDHLQAVIDAAAAGKVTSGTYQQDDWSLRCPLCILATGIDNGDQSRQLNDFYAVDLSEQQTDWKGHSRFYLWFDDAAFCNRKEEAIAAVLEVVAAEQQQRKEQSVA
jgi:hypothetical protein